jgi:hypothetical protein
LGAGFTCWFQLRALLLCGGPQSYLVIYSQPLSGSRPAVSCSPICHLWAIIPLLSPRTGHIVWWLFLAGTGAYLAPVLFCLFHPSGQLTAVGEVAPQSFLTAPWPCKPPVNHLLLLAMLVFYLCPQIVHHSFVAECSSASSFCLVFPSLILCVLLPSEGDLGPGALVLL